VLVNLHTTATAIENLAYGISGLNAGQVDTALNGQRPREFKGNLCPRPRLISIHSTSS
jgi:hypothetical protein